MDSLIEKALLELSRKEMERFCLELQRRQPEFIERNRRLMKAGKIDFDDYEEVLLS